MSHTNFTSICKICITLKTRIMNLIIIINFLKNIRKQRLPTKTNVIKTYSENSPEIHAAA